LWTTSWFVLKPFDSSTLSIILLFNKNTILNQSVCGLTWGYFLIPFITNYFKLTFLYWPKSSHLLNDAWIHAIADRKKRKKSDMVEVEYLSFANIKIRQKGNKKLRRISPLAWCAWQAQNDSISFVFLKSFSKTI